MLYALRRQNKIRNFIVLKAKVRLSLCVHFYSVLPVVFQILFYLFLFFLTEQVGVFKKSLLLFCVGVFANDRVYTN